MASAEGDYTLDAEIDAGSGKHLETLDFAVSAFNLSLPTRTARREIPVSGTAVPGSTVTFYEGSNILGAARSNSLGTWSGKVIRTTSFSEISTAVCSWVRSWVR